MRGSRNGFTLVELIVVVAIMSVVLGVSATAFAGGAPTTSELEALQSPLVRARAEAVRQAVPVTIWPDSAHRIPPIRILPDGRTLGDPRASWLDSSSAGSVR